MATEPPPLPQEPPHSPGASPPAVPHGRLALPLLLAGAGVLIIAVLGLLDARIHSTQVWRDALLAPEGEPLWQDAMLVRVRRLPLDSRTEPESFEAELAAQLAARSSEGRELAGFLGLDKRERIVAMPLPEAQWPMLLESGRPPTSGKPEVVAGDLARFEAFDLDGVTFRVTGRLQRGVAGLVFAYALPDDEAMRSHFTAEAGATTGWLAPDGLARLKQDESIEDTAEYLKLVGGITRTSPALAIGTILGLVCVAVGGAWVQLELLRRLFRRFPLFCGPVLNELQRRPKLLVSIHVLLYGALFVWMAGALLFPVQNLRMVQSVRDVFSTGPLSYVGEAYLSGNILRATWATFFNNFFTATLEYCILPSLVIPFAGVVKNLASFAFAGFVMAPLWSGSAGSLSYHCITMTLELEAYVIATFIITVFPLRLFQGLRTRTFAVEYITALSIVGSGTVLAGLMLALAALYEATTVILFR